MPKIDDNFKTSISTFYDKLGKKFKKIDSTTSSLGDRLDTVESEISTMNTFKTDTTAKLDKAVGIGISEIDTNVNTYLMTISNLSSNDT